MTPNAIAQSNVVTASSIYPSGLIVKDYTTLSKNTPAKIVWGSTSVCNSNYWKTTIGCQGAAVPWGLNAVVNYTPAGASAAVNGSLRAWHFLGDSGADKTKVWSINTGDTVNVLFYEFIDKSAGTAAAGAAYGIAESFSWNV